MEPQACWQQHSLFLGMTLVQPLVLSGSELFSWSLKLVCLWFLAWLQGYLLLHYQAPHQNLLKAALMNPHSHHLGSLLALHHHQHLHHLHLPEWAKIHIMFFLDMTLHDIVKNLCYGCYDIQLILHPHSKYPPHQQLVHLQEAGGRNL